MQFLDSIWGTLFPHTKQLLNGLLTTNLIEFLTSTSYLASVHVDSSGASRPLLATERNSPGTQCHLQQVICYSLRIGSLDFYSRHPLKVENIHLEYFTLPSHFQQGNSEVTHYTKCQTQCIMIYRAIEIFNSQCIDLAANNGSSENLF
jgi:hypothetical protein